MCLKNGLYIVVSQDCDILQTSLEKEPVIELISTQKIGSCNSDLMSGKNPRQLHIENKEQAIYLEFFPHNRYFIAREHLEPISSAEEFAVTGRSLKILINWITKRYKRPAFPDEFNRRISSKDIKKIKKVLSEEGKITKGLFVQIAPDKEIGQDEKYNIQVVMLVDKSEYDDSKKLVDIQNGFDKILQILDTITGLEVIEGSQVLSMDDVSMHRYSELKQWDFDYLSFINEEEGKTINESYL